MRDWSSDVCSSDLPRSVYRKFGLCRICLREMALGGQLPGVSKSSW